MLLARRLALGVLVLASLASSSCGTGVGPLNRKGTFSCSCSGTGCTCRHCCGETTDCHCRATDAYPGGAIGGEGD